MSVRRKRLLTVIVIVACLLGAFWIWQGGVDRRFVGTWKTSMVRPNFMRFRSDGTGEDFFTDQGRPPIRFRWRVEGNELLIDPRRKTGLARISEDVRRRFSQLVGKRPREPEVISLKIVEVGTETIRLWVPDDELVLTRSKESFDEFLESQEQ